MTIIVFFNFFFRIENLKFTYGKDATKKKCENIMINLLKYFHSYNGE